MPNASLSATFTDLRKYLVSAGRAWSEHQLVFHFPNGYEVSVIDDGYGHEQGLFEIALLHGGKLIYDAEPFHGNTIGWLNADQVKSHLLTILGFPDPDEN